MKIIFIRHGHPDYKLNCLTELGHLQAEAAAKRLEEEKIDYFYSSPYGRAYETAEHIAAPRNMKITLLDFMKELSWGSMDDEPIEHNGHPWYIAFDMVAKGKSISDENWQEHLAFKRNKVLSHIERVQTGLDEWLKELGFTREGDYYRICKENNDTLLLASHGGSSSAALAHLLNLSFPLVCTVINPNYTSLTILSFEGEVGELIAPKISLMNDDQHIEGLTTDLVYEQ